MILDILKEAEFEFWFSLFMIALCSFFTFLGVKHENGHMASVGALFVAISVYRFMLTFREAHLAAALKRNPELKKIYDARNK